MDNAILKMKTRKEELEDLIACADCDINNIISALDLEQQRIIKTALKKRLELERQVLVV